MTSDYTPVTCNTKGKGKERKGMGREGKGRERKGGEGYEKELVRSEE